MTLVLRKRWPSNIGCKMLEALPEPQRIRLKAISKAEDGGDFEPLVTPVRKGDGSIDEVPTEIKKIQRLSGRKIWG